MQKTILARDLAEIISLALAPKHMQTRIIAIDGCGGAGKSTLATILSVELGNCSVVHTDDFASWDNPLNWYPRMIEQVLKPLRMNKATNYQRFDWSEKKLSNWIEINPQNFLILEGVSSSRNEFRSYLSFSIYIKTPAHTRLQRGLARDGVAAKDKWLKWMATEDEYIERDEPEKFANLVVDGESGDGHSLLVL